MPRLSIFALLAAMAAVATSCGESYKLLSMLKFAECRRAAHFAARICVRAGSVPLPGQAGRERPLCHPPITVPGRVFGGRSRPRCKSHSSGGAAPCP